MNVSQGTEFGKPCKTQFLSQVPLTPYQLEKVKKLSPECPLPMGTPSCIWFMIYSFVLFMIRITESQPRIIDKGERKHGNI